MFLNITNAYKYTYSDIDKQVAVFNSGYKQFDKIE